MYDGFKVCTPYVGLTARILVERDDDFHPVHRRHEFSTHRGENSSCDGQSVWSIRNLRGVGGEGGGGKTSRRGDLTCLLVDVRQ